jgi:hypothetical protein
MGRPRTAAPESFRRSVGGGQGRYRPAHRVLEEHDVRGPGDHDLADVATTETLRHGSPALVVAANDIPGGGTAAATLRC